MRAWVVLGGRYPVLGVIMFVELRIVISNHLAIQLRFVVNICCGLVLAAGLPFALVFLLNGLGL